MLLRSAALGARSRLKPMAGAAVFFDLDRTLLRGASGPIITEALKAAGVIPDRSLPGERLVYRFFNVVGETLPSMFLTRQMARVAGGWDRSTVQEAGRVACARLHDDVQPFARLLIERHRADGVPVVLATTSPYDLVAPLAELLHFDDVIATRYGERDGAYDGTIVGDFVWGRGKLASVRRWAEEHDVDLAASWAYSDSFYDLPLLSAVAHPVAVNPDPRMRLVALARRWPVQHLDVPPGVPKFAGVEPQQAVMALARPELFPFARFDIVGTDRVPTEGPAIVVANHRSYFDPVTIGLTLARTGRSVRFLGKKEVFDAPVFGQLAAALGGIRVERGTGSDEPLEAAARTLRAGELVAVMPQGTIPRGRAFFDPVLRGRWGAARLAAMTRAPVIPIGMWGTEQVWPRSARLPNVVNFTNPPAVTVRVGEPVALKYRSPDADTRRIMAAITELLPPEAREQRAPSDDELRRSFPPGYEGDPDAEDTRRPGSD
ncbi:hypothetical protein BH20ACT2_BH20ACT2_00610 [soil metagenome]